IEEEPVAGDAGLLLDNGDTPADDAVDEGRLADVRPSGDDDDGAPSVVHDATNGSGTDTRRLRPLGLCRAPCASAARKDAPSAGTISISRGRPAGLLPSRKRPFERQASGSR